MENNLKSPPLPKYNIADRLDRIGNRRRLNIRRAVLAEFKIAASTWFRWLEINQGDKRDIPGEALILIARLIGVSVPELLNPKPTP